MLLLFWFGDTIIKTRKKQKWQKNYKIFSKQKKFKMVEGDQITNQNAGYNIHSQWSVLEWLANEDMCYLE